MIDFLKKLFEEDISGLSEYECFIKAQEDNWDYQLGTYVNPMKALRYLNRAIQLNPKKVEAYWSRGNAYQRLEKFDLAILNFNKAIELEPSIDNYRSRGLCYQQCEQYDNALKDYTKIIKLNPNELGHYIIRAGLYALLNEAASRQKK